MKFWNISATHEVPVDHLDSVVLIDLDAKFVGVVPAARLILAAPDAKMRELKLDPSVSVPPKTKEKEVFELFDKYNLRSLVVVDSDRPPHRRHCRGRRGEPPVREAMS